MLPEQIAGGSARAATRAGRLLAERRVVQAG